MRKTLGVSSLPTVEFDREEDGRGLPRLEHCQRGGVWDHATGSAPQGRSDGIVTLADRIDHGENIPDEWRSE